MECTRVPLVPVIVNGYDPVGVDAALVTVSVDGPVPVTEVGLNDVVVFDGTPEMLNAVDPEKPFNAVIETV